jgi:hypothetical protein
MALYEVMSKARLKPGFGRTMEKIREQAAAAEPETEKPVTEAVTKPTTEEKTLVEENTPEAQPKAAVQWWRKPRTVQLNAGRIEFSIPYQLAIVFILALVLLVLAAFRLGQSSYINKQAVTSNPSVKVPLKPQVPQPATDRKQTPPVSKDVSPNTTASASTGGAGKNNVIVLVEYKARADLVPVQAHFAEFGIETEIVTAGGRYLLITKNKYDNPSTTGTDGYAIRQKIIEVGAKYKGKAPEGYETFAPNFFKDAYGKRVD